MMGNPPDVKDPTMALNQGAQTAEAQQKINIDSWLSNLIGQEGPSGSLTYEQTGTTPDGNPIMKAITKYSPAIQQLFDKFVGLRDTAGTGAQQLLTGANYGGQTPQQTIGDLSKGITGGIMDQWRSFHTPFMEQEKARRHTELSNRGLAPGNKAYDAAMQELDVSHGLTINNLIGQTGTKAYELAGGMYKMPAELAQMLGGMSSPGTATQDFATGMPQVQPANLIGATANAQKAYDDMWKQETQKYGDMVGGAGQLAKTLGGWAMYAMMSDVRVKTDIVPTGAKINGIDVYSFRYNWEDTPRMGMMAHEVEKVMPDAVSTIDGIKHVDYSKTLAP